ncbi:MAG: phosphoribosylformylglycinamidine synthase I [Planctomycetes bacterium]|jgi:phosphoribosylformylglycinamidine synthase|nr:phosphoribosylformylglycinamidine synthase I [Planctomycetota bacterium]
MQEVRAIVLRAAGINTDVETEYALELAGARADRVHINRVIEDKDLLAQYHILIFPGGFSYGDDVAAGRIMANQVIHHLTDAVRRFIDDGKLVLGICNGFQVLVKAGILPGGDGFRQEEVTITGNDSGQYEDRWVYLAPQSPRCVFIEPGRRIYVPVAHGEGKVVTCSDEALQRLQADGLVAYTYVDRDGRQGPFPINPNGSMASIAGLTDRTGRVLGLMPHPERFVRRTQHPHWTRLAADLDPDGMTIFRNAVRYVRENLLQAAAAQPIGEIPAVSSETSPTAAAPLS